ncbi:MAG TPA: IPT/TIG domain-containing protein [Bryobacteraceae bacterium]|jgi:uncharacterized protein (TIGR03437 family)
MICFRRLLLISFCVFIETCVAQSIAIVPTGGASGTDARPFVIGYEFSVSAQTIVTGLAYLDAGGAGLNEPHMVGIFNSSDGSLLTSTTVPVGTGAGLVNGFRVVPVNYPLAPGNYVIGGLKMTNADYAIVRSPMVSAVAGIQYLQERELQTSTFTMPTVDFTMNESGSFGPGFTVAAPVGTPVITGLANSASLQPVFAPNTYISIFGTGLSKTTRPWNASDFVNGTQMPTALDGVKVTVGGAAAYVEYVSPTQLNIVTPNIAATGSGVPVVVNIPDQQPVSAWLSAQSVAPAFFTWLTGTPDSGKYLVAQHADYSNVGKAGLFPAQAADYTTPAKPGETILLYGTGFGPTTPAIAPGIMTDQVYSLVPLPTATIGGLPAQVQFAGLIPTLSQVYQFNITIPNGLAGGDEPLIVNVAGTQSASGLVTIAQ